MPSPGNWRILAAGEWQQALRSLRRTPAYAVAVIAVTALTMALASTVFAVVDGVLFKALPYPNPGELYVVRGRYDGGPPDRRGGMASPNEVSEWSAAAPGVAITGIGYTSVAFPDGRIARAAAIDRRFFEVFGVRMLMGGFSDQDYLVAPPIKPVVISHRLWQEVFGGDPGVVGRMVPPFGPFSRTFQIVGVMADDVFVPPLITGFIGPTPAARRPSQIDALTPPFTEALGERSSMAFARIPSERFAETRAALPGAVSPHRGGEGPSGANLPPVVRRSSDKYDGVDLVPLRDYVTSNERQTFALAFGLAMSLIALVLLNAGALAAARAQQRIRDIAIRQAIGARPRDLFRHALIEQILLATAGAAAGLLVAPLLLALVVDRLPPGLTLLKVVRIDWRVVTFAGLVTMAAAFVVSLLSLRVALRRTGVVPALADVHGRSPGRVRLGRWLVAGQTAIAFALVLGGALFASSLARLWSEDPGLRTANVVTMRLGYPEFPSTAMKAKVLALAQRSREVPGVRGAALVDATVMQNVARPPSFFPPPSPASAESPRPAEIRVSSDFFATAGVQLLAGRLPSNVELDTGTPVIAVSESAARAYWPDRPAIGQVLRGGRGSQTVDCTVVGVVPDIRLVALDVPSTGVIFVPWSLAVRTEFGDNNLVLLLESSAPAVIAQIRDRVSALDPAVRVSDVQSLEEAAANSIRDRRLGAFAASAFGIVALLFVALGLVGLVTMTAGRRTREIGIRLTLGAAPGGIARLLAVEQLRAAAVGLVAGGILATWVVPTVGARLYGVGAYDFGVWGASAVAILATSFVSAWLPARRASQIDPVASLRNA